MTERTRPYALVMPPSEHNHFVQLLTATLEMNELPVLSKTSKAVYTELLETYLIRIVTLLCSTLMLTGGVAIVTYLYKMWFISKK